MEEEKIPQQQQNTDANDQEIDLIGIIAKLWKERRKIIIWCAVGAVLGLVIAFSIPREYTVQVKLAPEAQGGSGTSGSLGTLAAMAGVNLSNMKSADAMSPDLYPDIVQSVPFMTELFEVPVTDKDGKATMPLYDYVNEELRSPWWSAVISAPFKALGWIIKLFSKEEPDSEGPTDPFRLTEEEDMVFQTLTDRITATVDNKTLVVSLSVTMQDPLIAATLTDTVMNNLQKHITHYRTEKARVDLDFTQKLYDEAQQKYYDAQSRYAKYTDQNQALAKRSFRTEQERLLNEMNLAFSIYNQTATLLQTAKAKVQELTPVYAVVQAATVPLKASKPSKLLILVAFVFLAGVAASGWILFGKGFMGEFKEKMKTEE